MVSRVTTAPHSAHSKAPRTFEPSNPETSPARPDAEALAAFARELDALRAELEANLGPEDFAHLKRMERWGRGCTLAGYATAWIAPNPLSAALLALGSSARWTIMAHHVTHGALDKIAGVPERYTSRGFAKGARRLLDWLDWIDPEAWCHEHNVLHHYRTGETADPDLVEDNVQWLRAMNAPDWMRDLLAGALAATWKLSYYAPNTFNVLLRHHEKRAGTRAEGAPAPWYLSLFLPTSRDALRFWARCVAPYPLVRFGLIPAGFLALGPLASANVLANTLGAELLTQLHTFAIIVPNHVGDDVLRFDDRPTGRAEFYWRQIRGSVNFATGDDRIDFLQGFLNYQIEHHLWPDLPPRKYQQAQPRVRAICEKYGVPYVQQGLTSRLAQLRDVILGRRTMTHAEPARPPTASAPAPSTRAETLS